MEMEIGIKEELMREARIKGICVNGFKSMRDMNDKRDFVKYYLKTINWSLGRDYPSLNFLRKHFMGYEKQGVYIDKKFHGETFSNLQCYVFHNCSGTINVEMDLEKQIIPMLYFANDCHITVICNKDYFPYPIRVPIYIFGENRICATDDDNITFIKYTE